MADFKRKELQEIRFRAEDMASIPEMNEGWRQAYLRLAQEAQNLDTLFERSLVYVAAPAGSDTASPITD